MCVCGSVLLLACVHECVQQALGRMHALCALRRGSVALGPLPQSCTNVVIVYLMDYRSTLAPTGGGLRMQMMLPSVGTVWGIVMQRLPGLLECTFTKPRCSTALNFACMWS